MDSESKVPKIIGISGYMGAGKDTVAEIIQNLTKVKLPNNAWVEVKEASPWKIKKFSKKLKRIASILTGIDKENFEDREFKNSFLGKEWEYVSKGVIKQRSVREFLQKLGTEAVRDTLHPDTWTNALFSDYKPIREIISDGPCSWYEDTDQYPNWLITDVRFPNEARIIKDRGGIVVRVNREIISHYNPLTGENLCLKYCKELDEPRHFSETALDNYEFDAIIDNSGSLEDLKVEVEVFLKAYKIL